MTKPALEEEAPSLTEIRARLDAALVALRGVGDPALPLTDIERHLGAALQHVYAALAERADHARYRDETHLAVEDVRAALGSLMATPSVDDEASRIAGEVARSLGALQQVDWTLADGLNLPRAQTRRPDLRASVGIPRLLDMTRGVVRPAVPLSEPAPVTEAPPPDEARVEPPPMTLEALRALAAKNSEALERFAARAEEEAVEGERPSEPPPLVDDEVILQRFGVAVGEHDVLTDRARELMEDLAMLGRMRRCTDPERWASGEECERRLLTKVDALAACGVDVFPELVRMLDDRPLPDPELTFGNVFFFLSIAGDDTFDQAMRLLEGAELDEPGMLEMCIDALVFAPHDRIDAMAARWLRRAEADWRTLGVEVLRRRRTLTNAEFDQLGHDEDLRVLASLARSMHSLPAPPTPGALGWFLHHAEEEVVRAALEAAMLMRRDEGYERARELTETGRGAWAEAAMFVGIAGRPEARAVLENDVATTGGSGVSLRALGWYGDLTFVPFLLGRLRDGEEHVKAAALDALERITGASIVDASIVPEYERSDEPFVRTRRDYALPGILDAAPKGWSDWWKTWGSRGDARKRYRWGHAYTPQDTFWELSDESFPQKDRPWAAMELAIRANARGVPDWHDWVIRQRASLRSMGA